MHYRASLEALRSKKAEVKNKAIADSGVSDRRVSCAWCGAVLCHQSAVEVHQRNNCPERGEHGVVVGALFQCRGVKGNRNARCGVTSANPEARDKHETESHQLYICKDAACPVKVDKHISNLQPWMVQKNWGSLAERAVHILDKGCMNFTGNFSSAPSLLAAFIGVFVSFNMFSLVAICFLSMFSFFLMAGRPHKKRGEIEHSLKTLKQACEEQNIRVYASDTAAKLFVQLYPGQPIPAKLTKKRKPRKKVAGPGDEVDGSVSGAEEEYTVDQDAAPRPSKLHKTEVFSASVGAQDTSTSTSSTSSSSSSSLPPF